MTVPSGTTTKYAMVGIREQLTDKIYNVAPMDTPVMTAIGRGPSAKNTKVEWQNDTLADAGSNAKLEGDDATVNTATATTRPCNYTQIFSKTVSVSGTAQEMDTAGRRNELLYQVEKRTKEIKRDIEYAITREVASQDGSAATARLLGGFESWLRTNTGRGSGGSDGGFTTSTSQTVAPTDASSTNLRTFTETRLKTELKSIWDNAGGGGVAPLIVVGSFVKQKASAMSGIASPSQQYPMGPTASSRLALIGAADIYISDFGKHRIVPNRFSRSRSALLIDPEFMDVCYLRPFKVTQLAKTGDSDKRQLIAELTSRVKNEKVMGVVADLLTS